MQFTLDLALDDTDSPARGDVLVAARVAYRVLDARPVDSQLWANRWRLTVESTGDHDQLRSLPRPDLGGRRWWTKRYRRGEGPHDHFEEVTLP